ncbi:hypothetical protein FF125_17405 [Aureibaculum algae]|uniref:DUF8164 domain-containing protein n=1 Tax=Aureibaculum algae TaxID=2584122 RepID=A0A5B7TTH1_9FLAO|nr:hypothetical protein [Aureibaculum algae]QCX40135.1 hypothetical protein FF125_17405 [Aureibaculum algae]
MTPEYPKDPAYNSINKGTMYKSHYQFGKHADMPGSYTQVLFSDHTNIRPGEKITIKHFISGYGNIDFNTAKMFFSPSSNFIDESKSFCSHGIRTEIVDKDGIKGMTFGGFKRSKDLVKSGAVLTLMSSFGYSDIKEKVTLFSESINYMTIFSEIQDENLNPPFLWEIQTKSNLKPGRYSLSFILTYFNGENWQNDTVIQDFKVLNLYERNETSIQIITFFFLLFTLISAFNDVKGLFTTNTNNVKPKIIETEILSKENKDDIELDTKLIQPKDTLNKKKDNEKMK